LVINLYLGILNLILLFEFHPFPCTKFGHIWHSSSCENDWFSWVLVLMCQVVI